MLNQFIIMLLGLFVGLYSTTVGGVAASAIMTYIFIHFKIIDPYDKIIGTLLFISMFPIGLSGLYEYYKRKHIDYSSGLILLFSISIGMFLGSKYNFIFEKIYGIEFITNYKYLFNSICFGIISILYLFEYRNSLIKK